MSLIFEQDRFRLQPQSFVMPKGGSKMEAAGAELVKELQRVGWDVPGIDVEFMTSGVGTRLSRHVHSVSGATERGPFRLVFGGAQLSKGNRRELTGLNEATVPPGLEIVLYEDKSPTVVHRYVGTDWVAEGRAFIDAPRVNSKLDGAPRLYVTYEGHSGVLKADDDMDREYSPEGDEPLFLDKEEVIDAVVAFVRDDLLSKLSELPTAPGFDDVTDEGDANLRRLAKVEPIPVPDDFPVLYAWIDQDDAFRIANKGRRAEPGEPDFVLAGNGWRLVALGGNPRRERLHDRAHDGFSYASADPSVRAGQVIHGTKDNSFPVEIKLRCLNDVYVVDNSRFEAYRNQAIERAISEGRDRLTNAEVDAAVLATALTMVPATEYAGGYGEPTYLIGRQVFADEARLMRGPIEVVSDGASFRTVITDAASGLEMQLYEDHRNFSDRVEKVARDAASVIGRSPGDYRFRVVPASEVGPSPAI